jgi:hypothetical protein
VYTVMSGKSPKTWTKTPVQPEDILNGAKSLSRREMIWATDPLWQWVRADEYLSWARRALDQKDWFGNDAAVCDA